MRGALNCGPYMENVLRKRVVALKLRADGYFALVLGSGSPFFVTVVVDPVEVGSLITLTGARGKKINGGQVQLSGGELSVAKEDVPRRVVSKAARAAVDRAVKKTLFPYQAEGAAWMAEKLARGSGALLADDPGLGKTVQAIAALTAARMFPVVVVCPSSVKHNWAREFRTSRLDLRVEIVDGLDGKLPRAHVLILNYELMAARESQLLRCGAKCVVFDEGHTLKEPRPTRSHRAAVGTRIAHGLGCAVILSGTPVLNRPEELFRLLHILDKENWPTYEAYRDKFCGALLEGERGLETKHAKVRNPATLRAVCSGLVLRRTMSQVLKLPEKTRESVVVELSKEDRVHYDLAEKNVVDWLKSLGAEKRASSAARGQAIVKLTMLRRIAALGKLRGPLGAYLSAWFRRERRPLVVFGHHKQVLDGVHRLCVRSGARISRIKGGDGGEKRQAEVDKFQRGASDVFIAPIRAGGQGLNLQRASDMLFLERTWTPSLLTQAEGRIHRLGQKRKCSVIYLDAKHTIDDHVRAVLDNKRRVIGTIMEPSEPHNAAETVLTVGDVMDSLLRRAGVAQ